MEAISKNPVTTAGPSVCSTPNEAILWQTKSRTVASAADLFSNQTLKGSKMARLYMTRIYNHKALVPFTLQYFEEEVEGFQTLSRKLGFSPTTLLKKAVETGMPLVVKSLKEKQAEVKERRS